MFSYRARATEMGGGITALQGLHVLLFRVAAITGGDGILEGAAARNHRKHVLDVRHHDVEKVRTFSVNHTLNRRRKVTHAHNTLRWNAETLSNGDKVRENVRFFLGHLEVVIRRAEVGVTSVRLVEAILPLHNHTQILVVQNEALDWQLFGVKGRELLDVHHERTV